MLGEIARVKLRRIFAGLEKSRRKVMWRARCLKHDATYFYFSLKNNLKRYMQLVYNFVDKIFYWQLDYVYWAVKILDSNILSF